MTGPRFAPRSGQFFNLLGSQRDGMSARFGLCESFSRFFHQLCQGTGIYPVAFCENVCYTTNNLSHRLRKRHFGGSLLRFSAFSAVPEERLLPGQRCPRPCSAGHRCNSKKCSGQDVLHGSKVQCSVYTLEDRQCGDQKPHSHVLHGRHVLVRLDGAQPLR